ncbi:hypothetical protein [Reyranella sp.]|uniref:hypothetical protein n=1 Tax=Reyranella sp. TaxID=1929291 RepID=UPI003D11616C
MTDEVTDQPIAPRRGRPLGLPKSGGRKKGVPNKTTADAKETILKRGKPMELLCDVARGLKIRVGPQAGPGEPQFVYPTLGERLQAARTLLAKVVPDVKAVEVTGKDGGPIQNSTVDPVAQAAALERLGEALRARRREVPPVYTGPPALAVVPPVPHFRVPPAPPPTLPEGYVMIDERDAVVVEYEGATVFKAIDKANALAFVDQHVEARRNG